MPIKGHTPYIIDLFGILGNKIAKCGGVVMNTRQVTRATHVRNRIFPRVKLIIKIIIILLIIFLGFIKSKSC